MHHGMLLLVVAVMASFALAAPTPSKTLMKRSFAVPVKGRSKLSPAEAMRRAANKYGFEISVHNAEDTLHDILDPEHGDQELSLPWWSSVPSSVIYVIPSASAAVPSIAWSSAIGFSSSAAPIASSSGAPASSEAAPSSSELSTGTSSSIAAAVSSTAPSTGGGEEGSVTATPEQNDSEYLSPVKVGGQTLNLDFDTGSADLWVFSTAMSSQQSSGHSTFDPSKSASWSNYQGASWEIQYGDGSYADGSVGFDTVSVGTAVVKKQCVELAKAVSGTFTQDSANDGLLGLAFSSINTVQPQPQKTFFENIMDDLDQPLFTADLEENASGTYEFGAIDSSKYTGDIHYTPVDNSMGFWQVQSKTYAVGGTQHQCTTCSPTVMDTGTSLLLMDGDVVKAYYAQVDGAQYSSTNGYTYPCSTSLPDFGVAIGDGYTATIKGPDLTYASLGGNQCFGAVQSAAGAGVQILGDVLFKQFFAVFDGGNMRFGIAEKP